MAQDTTAPTCQYCREHHDPDRGFSHDGHGINLCDIYRSRIATFPTRTSEDDRRKFGQLFAVAPAVRAAALRVVACWESGDLAAAVNALRRALEATKITTTQTTTKERKTHA